MTCDGIRERLGAYLDGEVSSEEGARVREHLGACTACSAELEDLRLLANGLVAGGRAAVPQELWPSIENRLDRNAAGFGSVRRLWARSPFARRFAAAALFALAVGAIGFGLFPWDRAASATEIDFSVLLDGLSFDVDAAFTQFVEQHSGEESSIEQAMQFASALNFAIPPELPGGFRLKAVFILRIGAQPGVATRYDREGEFLAAIFHPPVRKEDFGSHKDYECVVGQHRGHAVSVGQWTMVHVTDPTTCHCVLSRLNQSELPPILRAVAPDSTANHAHDGHASQP